jgi:hypothetical protein
MFLYFSYEFCSTQDAKKYFLLVTETMPHKKLHVAYLKLGQETTLSEIKKDFNELFPFLKIEFFRHKHSYKGANSKKELVTRNYTLQQLQKDDSDKEILINENMSVYSLEQLFQEKFGLSVQVFRQSGRSWLETTMTDDWSLKYQNEQGRELSAFLSKKAG